MRRPRTWSACTLSTPGITRRVPEDRGEPHHLGHQSSEPWRRYPPRSVVRLSCEGVVEYTEEVLVGLSDEFQELMKAIAAIVQVVLKDDCTLCQWYMDYTGLMYPMRPEGIALRPTSGTGTLQRLSRLVSDS